MINSISFFVEGLPKGQPRARAFARKFGATYSARMYDPQTADDWKESVWQGLQTALKSTQLQRIPGPVNVALVFVMPRPKSHVGTRGIKDSAPRWHIGKPDIDNLCKLVFDVVTKSAAVWHDDSQIIAVLAEKKYAAPNENSGCIVTISGDCEQALVMPTYRLQKPQN